MKYILILAFSCLVYSVKGQTRVELLSPVGDPSKGELRGPTGCILGVVSVPSKQYRKEKRRYRRWYKRTYGYYPNSWIKK